MNVSTWSPSMQRPRRGAGTMLVAAVAVLLLAAAAIPLVDRWRGPEAPWGPPSKAILKGAFPYQQQRPLSCEYASVHIGATLLGYSVSEYDVEAVIPLDANPHHGYRGNILGEWGNTDDYGVYNEPLELGLSRLGIPAVAWYGGEDDLRMRLAAGEPTVVWLGMRGEGYSTDNTDDLGRHYQLTTYMHVMLAYGYDEEFVYLSDPGTAVMRTYTWGEFLAMWAVMDGMALSLS